MYIILLSLHHRYWHINLLPSSHQGIEKKFFFLSIHLNRGFYFNFIAYALKKPRRVSAKIVDTMLNN